MKKGISVWAFPADWSLDRIFSAAREAGFDGVEVALAETGEVNLDTTPAQAQAIRDLAARHRIELYSVASGLYWKYSLTSGDAQTRHKALSIAKRQLEIANWLGCDTVLIVPGAVEGLAPGGEIVPYDTAYERALEAIAELKPHAERLRVSIGVENVWNKFLLSPLEMKGFIDAAQSPYVGAYFDVGNVLSTGYPEHWIRILGNRIRKVHFKDFKKSVGTIHGFVGLLEGDLHYPAVMQALKEIGYDNWVTAEVGYSAAFPEHSAATTANAMARILEGE